MFQPRHRSKPGRSQHRAPGAQVGGPVDDEEDVPRLLLHDLVEDVGQRLREDLGIDSQAEEPEGEEGIEALSVARAQEREGRILGHFRRRIRRHGDPVVLRQKLQHLGVAALFVTLQADRLGQKRVFFRVAERLDLDRGGRLGPRGLVPDRHGLQALQPLGVELGPPDLFRLEGVVGVDKGPAEQGLVLLGTEDQPL